MSQVSVFCPRCGQHKPTTITLSHAARGITFQGCGDCLTNELDVVITGKPIDMLTPEFEAAEKAAQDASGESR